MDRAAALRRALVLAVVAFGLVLRGWNLAEPSFWPDEAESSINALTILEHGVPADEYLGLPIFENMLVEPWPGHPEYEFRDISYTERGYPVYHGWLPFYSIAAAFWLAGIEPDGARQPSDPPRELAEHRFRTIVARAPALLFSAIAMLFLFACGSALAGPAAGWTSLLAASCSAAFVASGRQARYYSATLAMSAAAFYAVLSIQQRGRWRDYAGGAVAFAMLFHTHLLSTVALAAVFALTLPAQLRRPGAAAKLGLFAAITAAATVPWMVWVGFVGHLGAFPPARQFLTFPDDYAQHLVHNREYTVLFALAVGLVLACRLMRWRLPGRLTTPFLASQRAFLILAAWAAIAYAAFTLLVPIASYFATRLTLTVHTPSVLLLGVTFAAIARVITERFSTVVACGLGLAFLFGVAEQRTVDYSARWNYESLDVTALLATLELGNGARLYATPNDHLVLTYYTGLPFQSVAPVRREFLDRYPGSVVLVQEGRDTVQPGDPLSAESVEQAAREAGLQLASGELSRWHELLRTRLRREEFAGRVARIVPPLEELPAVFARLVAQQRELDRDRTEQSLRRQLAHPALRGMELHSFAEWWQAFFYRLVDPESRRGDRVNFKQRLESATAYVLPGVAWTLCHAPPLR